MCEMFVYLFLVVIVGVANAQTLSEGGVFVPAEIVGVAGEGLHLYPLGWSSEGRWGALAGKPPSGNATKGSLRLVVLDAVTDRTLFESREYSWNRTSFADEFWPLWSTQILQSTESFGLEPSRQVDVRNPKFITGGVKYIFNMEPAIPVDSSYSLHLSSSRGDSKPVYRSPSDITIHRVTLLGVLLSPFEERVLAVIREKPYAEGNSRYRFIGAHLALGFTSDRIDTTQTAGKLEKNLLTAVFNGQEYLVRARLAAGADPEIRDNRGYPVLLIAARLKHWQMVMDFLASGASPLPRDGKGRSVLHYAAIAGNASVVKAILAAGADRMVRDGNGKLAKDLTNDTIVRSLLH